MISRKSDDNACPDSPATVVAHGRNSANAADSALLIPTELRNASENLAHGHKDAQAVFSRLGPMVAARQSMRRWDPELRAFRDRAQPLTRSLPAQPAAVPLYMRGRARLIALDFDAKHHSRGRAAVEEDVRLCLTWIRQCGGRAIVDHSTSGGQHVLIPLPLGSTVTRQDIEPMLRVLAVHFQTLDITPMLNVRTGCITPPGSACREGGYRCLAGSLDAAVDALTVRSDQRFLAQLHELLGMVTTTGPSARTTIDGDTQRAPRAQPPRTVCAPRATAPHLWEGAGDRARLRAHFRCRTPMPRAVQMFAINGTAPHDQRWRAQDGRLDRSAARQSVLAAAVLRGASLLDVQAHLPAAGGDWAGLARAYDRYGRGAHSALRRDWITACDWAAKIAPKFLAAAHKSEKHTGGWVGDSANTKPQIRWLAAATVWIDAQWPRSSRRWTLLAVLQAMAYASAIAGTVVRGVPLVEVGGRSLSIMACLTETTVWQLLRDLRDLPGSPLLRTRRGAGMLADQWALVPPMINGRRIRPDSTHVQRVRVEPVHEAWAALGLRCRRIFELVAHQNLTIPADVIAAAGMSRAAGYSALATLTTVGLLVHQRGRITTGTTNLDSIAIAHGLPQARRDRIAGHRHQRTAWHEWLHDRFSLHNDVPVGTVRVCSRGTASDAVRPLASTSAPASRNTQPLRAHTMSRADRASRQNDRAQRAHADRVRAHGALQARHSPP